MDRNPLLVASHLLLIDSSERLLLAQRSNTGYEDGMWSVPAGHVDAGESAISALIREAHEELGIIVELPDVEYALTMHRADAAYGDERLDLFFAVRRWAGQVVNAEPHKCSALRWYAHDGLPADTIAYVRKGITTFLDGRRYCEVGWDG